MEQQVQQNARDLAALKRDVKTLFSSLAKNDETTKGIYTLATSVELLAREVKDLTDKLDRNVDKLEESLKSQGERIGALEKEPAHKWKTLAAQVTSIIVAAAIGYLMSRVGL